MLPRIVILLGLALLLAACKGSEPVETTVTGEGVVDVEDRIETEDVVAEPLSMANIELYFPSARETGLVGEYHEIFNTSTPADRVKQIVTELIGGPVTGNALRSLPQGTRLRQAFVLEDGTAYLDFSEELSETLGGGSQQELLAVYSIVDSVALNVREVRRVGILINGRPVETLNGHLDLRRPLPPDNRWILGSVVVELRTND